MNYISKSNIYTKTPSTLTVTCANCNSNCGSNYGPQATGTGNFHLFTSPLPLDSSKVKGHISTSSILEDLADEEEIEEMPTIQEALSLLYGLKFVLNQNSEVVIPIQLSATAAEENDHEQLQHRHKTLGLCSNCTQGLRALFEAHVKFSICLSSPASFLHKKFEKSAQRTLTLVLGREEDDQDWDENSLGSRALSSSLLHQFHIDKEVRVVVAPLELETPDGTASVTRPSQQMLIDPAKQAREISNKIKQKVEARATKRIPIEANLAAIKPQQLTSEQFRVTLQKIVVKLKENQNKPANFI